MKTLSVIVDSDSCTNEKPGQKEQICIDITIKKYEQISSKTPQTSSPYAFSITSAKL
jgi:hypothetical protein